MPKIAIKVGRFFSWRWHEIKLRNHYFESDLLRSGNRANLTHFKSVSERFEIYILSSFQNVSRSASSLPLFLIPFSLILYLPIPLSVSSFIYPYVSLSNPLSTYTSLCLILYLPIPLSLILYIPIPLLFLPTYAYLSHPISTHSSLLIKMSFFHTHTQHISLSHSSLSFSLSLKP